MHYVIHVLAMRQIVRVVLHERGNGYPALRTLCGKYTSHSVESARDAGTTKDGGV